MVSPSAALVAALLTFASSITGLPVPPDPHPDIILSDHWKDGRPLGEGHPEAAITDLSNGRITLYATWRDDVIGNCSLAHELVHWLQWTNRQNLPPVEAEKAAYQVSLECFKHYDASPGIIKWAEGMVKNPHVAR